MVSRAWICLLFAGFALAQSRTVILVRHAERAGGTDPSVGVSDAGRCRAEVLAGMLADAGIRRIFASEVARTQQTAESVAARLHLKAEIVAAKDEDTLVSKLRSGQAGTALVVGHSNTLPEIIAKLGGGTVPPIADTEFDRMFIVSLSGKRASVTTLHYRGCNP